MVLESVGGLNLACNYLAGSFKQDAIPLHFPAPGKYPHLTSTHGSPWMPVALIEQPQLPQCPQHGRATEGRGQARHNYRWQQQLEIPEPTFGVYILMCAPSRETRCPQKPNCVCVCVL